MAFQIFIQPFDEPGPLTLERIHRDLPHLHLEPLVESEIIKSGIPILRFITTDEAAGTIAEAWFIHNGHLYQIAMHAPGDPEALLLPWFLGFLQSLTFH